MLIRLNKHLASLGIASRRKVDQLILSHQIKVNGRTAILGQKIDTDKADITVRNKLIDNFPSDYIYLILNKPKYVLTTTTDDRGRPTVMDFVKTNHRLFPVGRLDYQSTGLVLLTNDGHLTNLITHPKYHLPKTYLATTSSPVLAKHLKIISRGVVLDGQKLMPCQVFIQDKAKNTTTLKIILYQGKKRQIRRMFKALGLNLVSLHRLSIGPINLGKLKAGHSRLLTCKEIKLLKSSLS